MPDQTPPAEETAPYLALTPAGVLHAHATQVPDATQAALQALISGSSLLHRTQWLALADGHAAILEQALTQGWVHPVSRRLQAPDVRLDNYLPHAIAGLSGTRTAALASEDGFCLARAGYPQAEADTLCVMAADFFGFVQRQHARGWTGTGRAVSFHESIDLLLPSITLCQFWVDGLGYWLILGGEPLLNNRALVNLIWGLRSAGRKFLPR